MSEEPQRTVDMAKTPIAYGVEIGAVLDREAVTRLTAPYATSSPAECFLGPGWVSDAGVATFVVVTHNARWVTELKRAGQCALLVWRWDVTPSMFVSLTVMSRRPVDGVAARWMCASDDPVVQAIRREARMRFCVALPSGRASPWFEATFRSSADSPDVYRHPLERLWEEIPLSGIPYSNTTLRFDPDRREKSELSEGREIPFWAEPVADFWRTLHYDGPWVDDLSDSDRARTEWGYEGWRSRGRSAGFIQVLIDDQRLDHKAPAFDASGRLTRVVPSAKAQAFLHKHPPIALLFAALAGPEPSAKLAHEAALSVLKSPAEIFAWIADAWHVLDELDDDHVHAAMHSTLAAAIRDAGITAAGTSRPWLTNAGPGRLELKGTPIDLSAPRRDIESFWNGGLEVIDLIEAGLRVTGSEFPAPFEIVCKSLEGIRLDGSVEEAEQRVKELLKEAQEARQWSIPWGARVEVRFGNFVALRIFEREGEFSCHFLDDKDRYFHVAIGLGDSQPKAVSQHLLRLSPGSGQPEWNTEAEYALKLIASAVVRDFLVVEERETVFTSRPFNRRIGARGVQSVIYLPRVRYSYPRIEQPDEPAEGSAHRARHPVAPHLRRAAEASAVQRFLAQRYGFSLPQGFTFVRPHERGIGAELERIRVYRSRSASRMIFEALDTAPEGTRPAWFDFEKDCARLLRQRGMQVIHQAANRDGDGGVDLYAIDADGGSWVVQCKCWATHHRVGPDIVRELKGAIDLADVGSSAPSRGMIIATSSFTHEATRAAAQFGFELIDGPSLAGLLAGAV